MERRGAGARFASVLVAAGLVAGALIAPTAAVADDIPDTQAAADAEREARQQARERLDEARDALRRAEAAHAAAEAGVRGARGASAAAEGQRRQAEDALAPAILERRDAEERRRETRLRVRALREDLEDVREELEVARATFDERVVRAYKQGSVAAHTALPLTIAREAASPGEFAAAMKDLESIAGLGALRVHELIEELTRLEAQLVVALAEREDARVHLAETTERVEEQEAQASARRVAADAAEAGLLTALRRELEAARGVDRARERVAAARAALERVRAGDDAPAASADRAVEETDAAAAPDDRAGWVAARERALQRQRSVAAEARRVADDWICPVEDSRFVNDWGFPRSQERRHEGTDVFAVEGTPILAVVDAEVSRITRVDRFDGRSGFGGLTVTYEAEGRRYYNAHLQQIAAGLDVGDRIAAGDVIGTVGRTGNARGTPPHLHLGVYVGDVAVNPYPSLAVACAADGRGTGEDADAELIAELDQRRAEREQRRGDGARDDADDAA